MLDWLHLFGISNVSNFSHYKMPDFLKDACSNFRCINNDPIDKLIAVIATTTIHNLNWRILKKYNDCDSDCLFTI